MARGTAPPERERDTIGFNTYLKDVVYKEVRETSPTQEDLLGYYEEHKTDDPPVELTPGVHWKVIEPEQNLRRKDYITYPSCGKTAISFRHEWVMVLQARPFVPQPSGAPMPEPG